MCAIGYLFYSVTFIQPLFVHPSTWLTICPSIYPPTYPSSEPSSTSTLAEFIDLCVQHVVVLWWRRRVCWHPLTSPTTTPTTATAPGPSQCLLATRSASTSPPSAWNDTSTVDMTTWRSGQAPLAFGSHSSMAVLCCFGLLLLTKHHNAPCCMGLGGPNF